MTQAQAQAERPPAAPAVEPYLTIEQVAVVAGISTRRVMQWVAEGSLPPPINPHATKEFRWNPEALRRWKLPKER